MATILSKDLPYDVVMDILSRLGVKTLMRLRCVCKSWYAIITNPTFITMHLNRQCSYSNNNNNYGYLQYLNFGRLVWILLCDQTYDHRIELEIPFDHSPLLVGTVSGLICLSSNSHNFDYTIFLWNPSIRKSKTLPSSSSTFPRPQLCHRNNYLVLGFGFHSQTNDYKIVRILYDYGVDSKYIANSSSPPVEIYSLSTDSWRRIEAIVPCYASHPRSDAFFNGCLHWVASRSVAHPDHSFTIMSFDIGGEVFGEIRFPNNGGFDYVDFNLAVLKESLSLCACFKGTGRCDIWVMREYGVVESWTKQFTIVMQLAGIKMFFGFTKNNVVFLKTRSDKLVSYDLRILKLKNLGIYVARCTSNVFPFVETLVLL